MDRGDGKKLEKESHDIFQSRAGRILSGKDTGKNVYGDSCRDIFDVDHFPCDYYGSDKGVEKLCKKPVSNAWLLCSAVSFV